MARNILTLAESGQISVLLPCPQRAGVKLGEHTTMAATKRKAKTAAKRTPVKRSARRKTTTRKRG